MDCNHRHKTYIPTHGHSTYSIGDGVTKIEDLIKRVQEIGADACALTEHGNMSSFLRFYKTAKANNIKPIIGCELYLNNLFHDDREAFLASKRKKKDKKEDEVEEDIKDEKEGDEDTEDLEDEYGTSTNKNSHSLVYSLNFDGLQNLIHLSNIGYENFYRKPLISTKLLFEKLDKNNALTTGCLNSEFNKLILTNQDIAAEKLILKYREVFEDNFYLEVQLNGLPEQNYCNKFYQKIAQKHNIKPIFALDYHYANKEDWYIQYLLYLIKDRKTINTMPPDQWFYGVRNLYIKEIDEIYEMADQNGMDVEFLEKAIDSTFELRDKTNMEIPLYTDNYPKFTDSPEASKKIFLDKLELKWQEKLDLGLIPIAKKDEYRARLEKELEIILSKGIFDYFLILDDLINNFVLKNGGATGAGRGCFTPNMLVKLFDNTLINIEDIQIGDIVKNYFNKETIVEQKFEYEIEEDLVELEFDNGKIIKCTFDHEILTDTGWKKAIDLNENDFILEIST